MTLTSRLFPLMFVALPLLVSAQKNHPPKCDEKKAVSEQATFAMDFQNYVIDNQTGFGKKSPNPHCWLSTSNNGKVVKIMAPDGKVTKVFYTGNPNDCIIFSKEPSKKPEEIML